MKIAVYCSSSSKIAKSYKDTAELLGKWIASEGHTLIYGGATGGLMDSVAEGAKAAGGEIIGVIPFRIAKIGRESNLPALQIKVKTMNERKNLMRYMADVFVVLPGGLGTFDEMFDVLASATVGEHSKTMIVVNENGFFSHIFKQMEHCLNEGFVPVESSVKMLVANNINESFTLLKEINKQIF